jgi:hypothetical protein
MMHRTADPSRFLTSNMAQMHRFLYCKDYRNIDDRDDIIGEFMLRCLTGGVLGRAALIPGESGYNGYIVSALANVAAGWVRSRTHGWTGTAPAAMWPMRENFTYGHEDGPCLTDGTSAVDGQVQLNDFESFLVRSSDPRTWPQHTQGCPPRQKARGAKTALRCFRKLRTEKTKGDSNSTGNADYRTFMVWRNRFRKLLRADSLDARLT